MTTKLQIAKLEATGNDFLVTLDPDAPSLSDEIVTLLCDRHCGIGADGFITVGPGRNGADCTMALRNADGSAAEMSGNGIRCLAWVATRAGLGTEHELVVDTAAGRRTIALVRDPAGEVIAAEVNMGPVVIDDDDTSITVHGIEYRGRVANIGNPHFVTFVDDPEATRVTTHGPLIERDPQFRNGANVEFVRVDGPATLTMRVWERGAGETLSCGTGACAAAAVANARGLVGDTVCMHVRGGDLDIALGETVRLGGPVAHVFDMDVEVS